MLEPQPTTQSQRSTNDEDEDGTLEKNRTYLLLCEECSFYLHTMKIS